MFDQILQIKQEKSHAFNTRRTNPSSSLISWKTDLPWSVIDDLQRFCKNPMLQFGYKIYNSSLEMQADTEFPLTEMLVDFRK